MCGAVEDHTRRHPRQPIIVFLDELPWLASHRSGLLQALDHAWNSRLSKVRKLRLIVCGSAAAWMLDRLVHAKGGLYNRITRRIELRPFTLAETASFLESRGVELSRRQLALLFMAIGGIPHYLKQARRGRSVNQIIGELCFAGDGLLTDEFDNLFRSLFSSSETHAAIVRTLAARRSGLSQQDLAQQADLSGGGRLKAHLLELEASGFVASFNAFGKKKNAVYRLVDEFSYFHQRWIDPAPAAAFRGEGLQYWQGKAKSPAFATWIGYAFENLCLKHVARRLLRSFKRRPERSARRRP